MWWILALIAFGMAAIFAIAVPGFTVLTVVGIIAIGLFFLALDAGGWAPSFTPRPRP